MKKIFLSLSVVATFIFYSFLSKRTSTQASFSNPSSTSPNSLQPSISNSYKNGQFTGSLANAFYGNVQVQATVQNGQITNVQFLQYPNSMGHTMMVSRVAIPILRQEALKAQSAKVNIVSGATDTSQAFIESLSSALSQAK